MIFFFFNDTATTEIYTLSLRDALPIFVEEVVLGEGGLAEVLSSGKVLVDTSSSRPSSTRDLAKELAESGVEMLDAPVDRKSTRLNSSHANISYAVFCLKKKIIDPALVS